MVAPTGILSDIRGLFQAKYQGRYLARIISSVARHDPRVLTVLFPKLTLREIRGGELNIVCEFSFDGVTGRRIADIAVQIGPALIALAELKVEDQFSKSNAAQMKDYLRFSKRHSTLKHFTYLTKYPVEADERAQIAKFHHGISATPLQYSELYRGLIPFSSNSFGIAELTHFIEDEGMAGYKELDGPSQKAVKLLLTGVIPTEDNHGLGRMTSRSNVDAVPSLLLTLFGNVSVIADKIQATNPSVFPRAFARRLDVVPYYDRPLLGKYISKDPDTIYLPTKIAHGQLGGELSIRAMAKIPKSTTPGGWMYFDVGFAFSIEVGRKGRRFEKRMYAGMFSAKTNIYVYSESFVRIPGEARAFDTVRRLFSDLASVEGGDDEERRLARRFKQLKLSV